MLHLDLSKIEFVQNDVCDLCGSAESRLKYQVRFIGHDFRFVCCTSCGLVYQNPLLSRESRNHLYETTEYWDHKDADTSGAPMLSYYSYLAESDNRRRTNEFRLKWVLERVSGNSSVLDLGCADGLYVQMLAEAGYKASGMDISTSMIAEARKNYKIEVVQADFEKVWPFSKPFDAITCYTVQNFVSATRVFTQIQKFLRPGGYFFFNFGDYSRLCSRLLGSRFYLYRPTVANIYSKKCIIDYCLKHGLQVQKIKSDNQVIPLARTLGTLMRTPKLFEFLKRSGLDKVCFKMSLPTSYLGCAIRKE